HRHSYRIVKLHLTICQLQVNSMYFHFPFTKKTINRKFYVDLTELITVCESSSERYRDSSFLMAISCSYVTERGLIGDRTYAIVDKKTGKVASAKNPTKWGKLFDFRSIFIDPPQVLDSIPSARITFPDGTHSFSNQNDI